MNNPILKIRAIGQKAKLLLQYDHIKKWILKKQTYKYSRHNKKEMLELLETQGENWRVEGLKFIY